MKRDDELVRNILLQIEKRHAPPQKMQAGDFDLDVEKERLTYHIKLLVDAGFVDGSVKRDSNGSWFWVDGLTWDGSEFLDNIRSDKVWKTTMERIGKKTGAASLKMVAALAQAVLKQELGL
jgi:hypothetical protein